MTEEIKKLIESCFIFQNKSKTDFLAKNEDMIRKSDFDRVVEELTNWHKVEDGLPEIAINKTHGLDGLSYGFSKPIYFKDEAQCYAGFFSRCDLGDSWVINGSGRCLHTEFNRIMEWKYIY